MFFHGNNVFGEFGLVHDNACNKFTESPNNYMVIILSVLMNMNNYEQADVVNMDNVVLEKKKANFSKKIKMKIQ